MSQVKRWLGAVSALAMLSLSSAAWSQTNGLRGEYYNIRPLGFSQPSRGQLFGCKQPEFVRIDPNVDFDWGAGAPNDADGNPPPQIGDPPADWPVDGYAVRWTGTLEADAANAGPKIFVARSDDGMRIWVKNTDDGPITPADAPVTDYWFNQGPADRAGSTVVNIEAGETYHILIEFYENGGGAVAQAKWRAPDEDNTAAVAIPTEVLTPAPAPPAPTPDNVAPGAPGSLAASDVTHNQATLTFTAPGDDGNTGTASCYEIRRSIEPLTDANFTTGINVGTGLLLPAAAGTSQTFTMTGLQPLERYHVAIRAHDEAGNTGPISNVVVVETTLPPVLTNGVTGIYYQWPSSLGGTPDRTALFVPEFRKFTRVDPNINFGFSNPVAPGVTNDFFAGRWVGTLTPTTTGDYTFYTSSDDGIRFWISEDPIDPATVTPEEACSNNWVLRGEPGAPGDICDPGFTLNAGTSYHILLEFFENGGGEGARLRWTGPGIDTAVPVPQSVLTPSTDPANAPSPLARVHGQLVDPSGQPINGATVQLRNSNNQVSTATTNAQGLYSVLVAPGEYTIGGGGMTATGVRGVITASGPVTAVLNSIVDAPLATLAPIPLPASLPAPTVKLVYRDAGETTNWNGDVEGVVDQIVAFFEENGYTVVDAAGMKEAMDAQIANQTPTVIVFANDIIPATVVELDENNAIVENTTMEQFLNAGGRILFSSDIPFYNISNFGVNVGFGQAGSAPVIGINASGGSWGGDGDKPVLMPAGEAFGLTQENLWNRSLREARSADVDITLARSPDFNAAGWIKFFPTTTGTGMFIRVVDEDPNLTTWPLTEGVLQGMLKLANFGGPLEIGTPTPTGCKGDANGDGAVNVADAVAILQHAVNIGTPLSGQNLINAQVTAGDTEVNVADAVAVLQAIVGVSPGKELVPNLTCP